jgi:hypothetical protein
MATMKASSLLLLVAAATTIPGCCSSSVVQASSTTAQHHGHEESSGNSAALFRAEAAVHADAAILDQETGRVFWEGSSTLQASLAPKFRIIPHFRATILTLILWTSGLRYALDHLPWRSSGEIGWFATSAVRRASDQRPPSLVLTTAGSRVAMIGLHLPRRLFSFLYRCIRCIAIPHVPKWLLIVTAVLYVWESWTCSTHQYLSNTVYDMEDRIQTIRQTDPTIQWTVRTFHYGGFHNLIKNVTGVSTQFYNYKSCRDRTFAGVWKRAAGIRQPRFVRATVTKIIVLSTKARRSYFQQQAAFLKAAGTDEFSEFSTRIGIPGCSRVLLQATTTTTAMSHHHDDGQGRWSNSGLYVWRLLYLFCTMISCSVPFRYWLSNCSNYVKITIVKELYDSSVNDEKRDDFVWPKHLAEIR